MLRQISCLLFLAFPFLLASQPIQVTFRVDMSDEIPSANGVHIAGTFQSEAGFGADWNPAVTQMTDSDGDSIFEITLGIPAGTYEYKFINGNNWSAAEIPPASCTVGGNRNRQVTVSSVFHVLPVVKFNTCPGRIKCSVDMNGQAVSPDGVYVTGDFLEASGYGTNWDPALIRLQDLNQDGFYEAELQAPPGNYSYIYVNGSGLGDAELLPAGCSVEDGTGLLKRSFRVQTGSETLLQDCWAACGTCNPALASDYPTFWWNDAVFYEIFVRSFFDSDNNGIGDFKGIIQQLDYLNDGDPNTTGDLGITALWLMPMMQSPSYHGYDVTDYYATENDYGTMADFKQLLDSAHARGIKVIIDLVLNHSSSQHTWFVQSASSQNGYRDWYVWKNNVENTGGPLGTAWHQRNGSYYYGVFYSGMPDLNYTYQPVRDKMLDVTKFWLNQGADGYRLDAIKYLVEDDSLQENAPATFVFLEQFNDACMEADGEAFTVGEVWDPSSAIVPYVQNGRLKTCFEFELAGKILNGVNTGAPSDIVQHLDKMMSLYRPLQYSTFLTNHDIDRVMSQLGNSIPKMKLAASLLLTLPGVPFLYYGEEVGMTGTGADENKRKPMQWTGGTAAGFSTRTPWSSVGANYTTNNVALMAGDSNSLLNHYKKLIRIRNEQAALRRGNYLAVSSASPEIMAFARCYGEEAIVVASNFGTNARNAVLSLPESNLQPGTYFVSELYSRVPAGMLNIDATGGFSEWLVQPSLDGNETLILLLSTDDPLSGLEIRAEKNDLVLSPNPATNQVLIRTDEMSKEETQLTVFDSRGKMVLNERFRQEIALNTSGLSDGMYLVRIVAGKTVKTGRLVILR